MDQSNKHHHRKTKKKDVADDKTSNATGSQTRSSREIEIEEGSRLHLGESTLQTPEEHKTDAATDQSKTDRTTVPRDSGDDIVKQ